MSIRLLENNVLNKPVEVSTKSTLGSIVSIIGFKAGDWIGVQIFRNTGRTLANTTPRWISNTVSSVSGTFLNPINDYFEAHYPEFGRRVIAPLTEEVFFRGFQIFILSHFLNMIARVVLTAFLFTYAHESAQPGRSMGLLFVGLILGLIAEWNEVKSLGLLTAVLTHACYNTVINRFYR